MYELNLYDGQYRYDTTFYIIFVVKHLELKLKNVIINIIV